MTSIGSKLDRLFTSLYNRDEAVNTLHFFSNKRYTTPLFIGKLSVESLKREFEVQSTCNYF